MLVQLARDLLQVGQVDGNAGELHLAQHWNQRHFEVPKEFRVAEPLELGLKPGRQLQHDPHTLPKEGGRPRDIDLITGHRRLAAAEEPLAALDRSMQHVRCQRLEAR